MKTLVLAFLVFASPTFVFAQSQVPKPKAQPMPVPHPQSPQTAPAEKLRYEWVEFPTSAVVDIEFEPLHGILTFGIEDERFKGIRFILTFSSEHEAARASGGAAMLAELRHADKIKLQIATPPDGKGKPLLVSLILCYSKGGPAKPAGPGAPRKIN